MKPNEIIRLNYARLRNETHVEYHEVVDGILLKYDPVALGYKAKYDNYHTAFNSEVNVLDIVQKSPYTQEIVTQDELRDNVYQGLVTATRSFLFHFNESKRKAAERIEMVINSYGKIKRKTYDQETAAIDDLLRELFTAYSDDVALLGIGEWTNRLADDNEQFKNLMQARYQEISQRPASRMAIARKELDTVFAALLKYIEALMTVAGDISAYLPLVAELNSVTTRYRNLLAQQQGRRKAKAAPAAGTV